MDWTLAIHRNRDALRAVVAAIAALLGGHDGGLVARGLRSAALALLRPAESAARRLIVIAARGLPLPLRRPAAVFTLPVSAAASGAMRAPAFRLFDQPHRFAPLRLAAEPPRGAPRIRTFWGPAASPLAAAAMPPAQPAPPSPAPRKDPAAPMDASRLRLRLAALERALADLPRQARRLMRWRGRFGAGQGRHPRSPLRFGRPPGQRVGDPRDIDRTLRECHALARDALASDTS